MAHYTACSLTLYLRIELQNASRRPYIIGAFHRIGHRRCFLLHPWLLGHWSSKAFRKGLARPPKPSVCKAEGGGGGSGEGEGGWKGADRLRVTVTGLTRGPLGEAAALSHQEIRLMGTPTAGVLSFLSFLFFSFAPFLLFPSALITNLVCLFILWCVRTLKLLEEEITLMMTIFKW